MIKPLYDNVLIKNEKVSNTTNSGIILTQKEEKEDYAIVIAVGDGKVVDGKKLDMPVKVNDKVLYKKYGGTEVKYNDEEYILISAEDILAIIE